MSEENEVSENQDDMADAWAAALDEQEGAEGEGGGDDLPTAEFDQLEDNAQPLKDEANLDVILDIPVTISMEIGRTHISIRNLLQLNQGSVVELDRLAGEPMDVLVNGTLVAHGEVVDVNEKFGIRIHAFVFLRNQVRSILQLTEAAKAFGRGQDIADFRPSGATEVRDAARASAAGATRPAPSTCTGRQRLASPGPWFAHRSFPWVPPDRSSGTCGHWCTTACRTW